MQTITNQLINIFDVPFPDDKPWLIIGKGPSYERVCEYDLDRFYTIGLNQVPLKIPVDYGHRMDYWGLDEYFYTNCKLGMIMPMYPHINYKPNPKNNLYDITIKDPIAKKLRSEHKLFWYNHSKSEIKNHAVGDTPIVNVRYFSSEAVFGILCIKGIREIRSIGIDKGNLYSRNFWDCNPLKNGQKNFDKQWITINNLIQKYKVNYVKL